MVNNRPKRWEETVRLDRVGEPRRSERRERRSPLCVILRVYGFSAAGRIFSELTSTSNISRSGCCIQLRTRPLEDTDVAVQVVPDGASQVEGDSPLLYQIKWMRPSDQVWSVGLVALTRSDLLQVAFASDTP